VATSNIKFFYQILQILQNPRQKHARNTQKRHNITILSIIIMGIYSLLILGILFIYRRRVSSYALRAFADFLVVAKKVDFMKKLAKKGEYCP
jgi:hypothetical protein